MCLSQICEKADDVIVVCFYDVIVNFMICATLKFKIHFHLIKFKFSLGVAFESLISNFNSKPG